LQVGTSVGIRIFTDPNGNFNGKIMEGGHTQTITERNNFILHLKAATDK